ncbi:MAG TPA: hypothetical protein VFI49_03285 [Rudaea sp.]|nr:hypothetical protein [Rudaea sp.]
MKTTIRILLCSSLVLFVTALWAAAVEGTYSANGRDARLVYAFAKKGEPFSGKPVTLLIFSEQDASKDPRPEFQAQKGGFGDALVIHLMKDGNEWDIIGSEFAHSALKHSGVSGTGIVSIKDVTVANGEISGHLMTHANAELFDEPLVVDLQFHVKQP